jgi:hypothetical protein
VNGDRQDAGARGDVKLDRLVARRPRIDRTAPLRQVLRDVRRQPETAQRGHEAPGVIPVPSIYSVRLVNVDFRPA